MNNLRRLRTNVPVLRFGVAATLAVLIAAFALLAAPALMAPALAAEGFGDGAPQSPAQLPALPPGLSPEQADVARQMLQASPEARKAMDAAQAQKDEADSQAKKRADAEAARKERAAKGEAGDAAKADLASRYDWKNSVYVSNLFSKRLREAEVRTLGHFGHELFAIRPGGGAALENMPVSPNYIVGPGDEIVVKMWGRVEGTQRMTVDRDGKIFFPKFGSLYVAGKTFEELRSFLKARVSTIAEVSSDVSLGQMKGIRVSVIGEAIAPGWYNVSSLHTVLQVLAMAGGVKDIGSLRRIELHRGGQTIQTIDLYDFLLKGETGPDARLLQGDVIFIPVVGKLVALAGEVRRPAIYELKEEKTLLDLVRMAGSFAPAAYKRRVQVERLEGHTAGIVLDVDAEELEKSGKEFGLADGDIARVLPIALADVNAVTLEGNVIRPGRYELKPGMTVGTLLKDGKDFLPGTYFDYALLTRLVPPDLHKEILPLNLREIVLERKTGADIPLRAQDTVTVYNRSAFRDLPKATISGEVRLTHKAPGVSLSPDVRLTAEQGLEPSTKEESQVTTGKVALGAKTKKDFLLSRMTAESRADNNVLTFEIQAGMRVADLVQMAGGLTRLASLERAEVVRVDENRAYRTIYFHLGKAVAGDPNENVLLENEDHVQIHSIMETRYKKTVTAAGEVNNPAEYVLTGGMRLSDLLFKAGGFTESAYTKEAEVIRREVTPQGDLVRTQTLEVSPDKALRGEAGADLPLKENDLVVIRQIPDWSQRIMVVLTGEVQFPGMYPARKGERLSSVVARAGGFTKDAYLKAAQFIRVSTQKTQQEAIDKLIDELELEVAQKGQQVSGALDKEDLEANKELVASRLAIIAQLKKTRAKGRVIIRLAGNGQFAGSQGDVLLEDGDRLEVPRKMNVVNVVGRVYNPTGVVFDPARDSVGYYLRLVGGPTETADRDHIFLLKADGSVVTRETSNTGFFAFGERGLMSARVEPGDSILVPEKLVQTRFMKEFKDITQILYQIAVTAGVLIVVF